MVFRPPGQVDGRSQDGSPKCWGWRFFAFGFVYCAGVSYDELTHFGLAFLSGNVWVESTVGVSWAITLDIGADSAGAVSALMNTWGNTGGAIASALSAVSGCASLDGTRRFW